MERIVKKIDLSHEQVTQILWSYGLSQKEIPRAAGGGRIANNLLVTTPERGEVIIRTYPHAYGAAKVQFEIDILRHLSEHGCDVPRPLSLERNRKSHPALLSLSSLEIFVYPALEGTTIAQSELTPQVAAAAGKALAKIAPHSISFSPSDLLPHGDLGFIAGLLRAAKERDSALALHPIAATMELVVSDAELFRGLAATSSGIVHADYFFENVLSDSKRSKVTGILDFGDAYYGYVVHDAIIGAMEFSVLENESWELASWEHFLKENQEWLRREKVSSQLMRKILLANCIRFAMYTLPFTFAEGITLEQNRYVQRFLNVQTSSLGKDLEDIWNEVARNK